MRDPVAREEQRARLRWEYIQPTELVPLDAAALLTSFNRAPDPTNTPPKYRTSPVNQQYRSLLLAMIGDAIELLDRYNGNNLSKDNKGGLYRLKDVEETIAWINGEAKGDMPILEFDEICWALELNPDYIRKRLLDPNFGTGITTKGNKTKHRAKRYRYTGESNRTGRNN